MEPFESFKTVAPVISIEALSVLALIMSTGTSGDCKVPFNFDILSYMNLLSITPSVLGDDWLFKGLQRNENDIADWASHLPYQPLTMPMVQPVSSSGIEVNDEPYFTPAQIAQNAQAAQLVALQTQMQALDEAGDIDSLMQIPEAVAMLKQWASFHVDPIFYTVADFQDDQLAYTQKLSMLQSQLAQVTASGNDPTLETTQTATIQKEIADLVAPSTPVGEITNMKLTGQSITTQSWYSPSMSTDPASPDGQTFWNYVYQNYTLDFSDYWKCLNVLKTMQASDLFSDMENVLDKFGSITTIETRFQPAYAFVLQKQLNLNARKILAANLGIPYSQLGSRYDSQGNIIFYQKKAS
jgi:hypothetical protein